MKWDELNEEELTNFIENETGENRAELLDFLRRQHENALSDARTLFRRAAIPFVMLCVTIKVIYEGFNGQLTGEWDWSSILSLVIYLFVYGMWYRAFQAFRIFYEINYYSDGLDPVDLIRYSIAPDVTYTASTLNLMKHYSESTIKNKEINLKRTNALDRCHYLLGILVFAAVTAVSTGGLLSTMRDKKLEDRIKEAMTKENKKTKEDKVPLKPKKTVSKYPKTGNIQANDTSVKPVIKKEKEDE